MKEKRKGGRPSQYSAAFKTRVALEYLNTDRSLREVANDLNLHRNQVYTWVRLYEQQERLKNARTTSLAYRKALAATENAEILQLRSQVEELQLKLDASETMIKVAEKELEVSIRKKFGSRQSNKCE